MIEIIKHNQYITSSEIKYPMDVVTHFVEHFRLLIDESIKIRNWKRGEKYCSLLRLVKPLDISDTLKWCKCLYHLSDYFAVIRITESICADTKSELCVTGLQLLVLRSESEFSIGEYNNCVDTSNVIIKNVTKMANSNFDPRHAFFLKQMKINALLIQARIYELNNINDKFIEINKNILLNEDPLNISAIKSVFFSQRLFIEDKFRLLEEWERHVTEKFKWIFYIVQFRVLCDQFTGINIDFKEIAKLSNFNIKHTSKIPLFISKMSFVRDLLYPIPFHDNSVNLYKESRVFDPSNCLNCEREIIMRTTSTQNDIGSILTATNILYEKIPLSPLSLFSMGCYYYKQSIYSKSAHLFRRVIELEPGFYEAHLLLAHSLSLNNNHSQALLVYSFIQDQWRGSYYGSLYKGIEYLKSGEYEMAKLNIEKSLHQNFNNPVLLNEYGVLQFYRKQYKEAIAIFRRALDSNVFKEARNKDLLHLLRVNLSCSLIWSFLYCDGDQDIFFIDEVISLLQDIISNKNVRISNSLVKTLLAIAYQITGNEEKAMNKYLECLSLKNPINLDLLYLMCN
ncbi:subunit of the anaphase-promoting complex cyclosome [Cryptosporidium bovis]|uniref:subunit of the anaphase-promoting complex cyclosome n=1 Tax=Cryptosporidium bovis TaxID=310047 RepID=UPI00351AAA7F|nr:subunit of the anaphase-promoting complex cyclosome [Cryptosporidium bovis]